MEVAELEAGEVVVEVVELKVEAAVVEVVALVGNAVAEKVTLALMSGKVLGDVVLVA